MMSIDVRPLPVPEATREKTQTNESSLKTGALLLLGFKGRDMVNIVPPSGGHSTAILP